MAQWLCTVYVMNGEMGHYSLLADFDTIALV